MGNSGDISIVHSDGTVTTIYDRATSESLSYFTGGGETNPAAWVEHAATAHTPLYPEATTTYFLADQIHSTRMTLAYGGWPMTQDTYYPFGVETTPSASPDQYKFSGKERDPASGLDNFGARYYSAVMGRFMTPDPLGGHLEDPQTLNKYAYALNNPLTNTDPTGLYICKADPTCNSKNDKSFANSLAVAQTAANALKNQYGAKSSEYTSAQRAINSYGAQNIDNGVTVGFSTNISGGLTNPSGVANGVTSKDNPNGQNIQVTFNPNVLSQTFSDGLVVHEGSHVADASAWVASGFSPGMNPTKYGTEIDAYHVQFNIDEATFSGNMMYGANIGGVPMFPGEPFNEFRPDIQNMLRTSSKYGLDYTPKRSVPAFVKGSVVPQ